jgi:hypothetical protein
MISDIRQIILAAETLVVEFVRLRESQNRVVEWLRSVTQLTLVKKYSAIR